MRNYPYSNKVVSSLYKVLTTEFQNGIKLKAIHFHAQTKVLRVPQTKRTLRVQTPMEIKRHEK